MTIAFTDDERDCLTEFCNIAVGRAAASLSEMVDQEVLLSVPDFEVMSREQAVQYFVERDRGTICVVNTDFDGAVHGNAYLLFPHEQSLQLVRCLLQEAMPVTSLTELERDALLEVGNVILNGFLGELSNILEVEFISGLPQLTVGPASHLLDGNHGDATVILFRIEFGLSALEITGFLLIMVGVESAQVFKNLSLRFAQAIGLTSE